MVVPQLAGLRELTKDGVVSGKHLEPIEWREGLHYVRARREQWVHVPDLNSSTFEDPASALAVLNPPMETPSS